MLLDFIDDDLIVLDDDEEETNNDNDDVIIFDDDEEEKTTQNSNNNNKNENGNTLKDTAIAIGNTNNNGDNEVKDEIEVKKARDWMLTINPASLPYYEDIKTYLMHFESLNYILITEHFGQKKKHYHVFCQFKNGIKLDFKKLHGAHAKKRWHTPQACYDYLLCNDPKHKRKGVTAEVIYEWGIIRLSGKAQTIANIKKMTPEERDELDPRLYNIANKIIEEEREKTEWNEILNEIRENNLKAPEIIYVTGEPGKGKTYGAIKEATNKEPDNNKIGRVQINNNFFKFINENAETLIINEFRPTQLYASDFLEFTDKYGFSANIKGGFKFVRPKRIYICSTVSPFNLYKEDNEKNRQFLRRITKLYTAINEGKKAHKLIDSTQLIKAKLAKMDEPAF